MRLVDVTPLIITFDEAPNIGRTLAALAWAKQILVLDSGSTDGTLAILRSDPRVEVTERPFDSFAGQCNAGLTRIRTEWVLSIDADYVCSPELVDEIRALPDEPAANGYSVSFRYWVYGRPIRGALYPPRTVLYRRAGATYHDDGHGHHVFVPGEIQALRGTIAHDDRKPIRVWLAAQDRYARAEADKLVSSPRATLKPVDRLRRLGIVAPLLVPLYCLVAKGLLIEGWRGWFYTMQRTYAEVLLALHLFDRRGADKPA